MYSGERLPGVLFSPLILFIPFLWLMTRSSKGRRLQTFPAWTVTLFPFIFYPLFQVEPRYFFFAVPTIQMFGVAGLCTFASFVTKDLKFKWLVDVVLLIFTVLIFIPFILVLAWNSEQKRSYHREVGDWIKNNYLPETRIAGDGYGYTNTFWAGIPKKHSRIWTDNAADLYQDTLDHNCSVLIIVEEFINRANPQLKQVLDEGIPKMEKVKEFKFPRVGRVQIYAIPDKNKR